MRPVVVLAVLLSAWPAWAAPDDRSVLGRARTAYNAGRYDAAIGAARNAVDEGADPDAARLVLGRSLLERYRLAGDAHDLLEAREALRAADASRLPPADRAELLVGLGQWLFFTDRFGPAAELFEVAAARPLTGGAASRDRVLDWWASALDREAQASPAARDRIYARVFDRMEKALGEDPGSVAANYWLVASARAVGDLDRAWQASMAAWVRSMLAERGAELRADLDRLVLTSIIPERARETAAGGNERQAADTMVTAWEQFKAEWGGGAPASAPASPPGSAPRR
jgi:tetratricopeptide (TPR) repeat protein